MATAGFNANYYVQTYPDVLIALSRGTTDVKTAEEHFEKYGAKEGRNPNANFDSTYYLANNPDVLNAVRAGTYASAYDHYIKNGGKEGRIPSAALANFNGAAYLAANADLATAGYTAANVVAHYVLYGAAEGRSGGTAQQVTGNYSGTTGDDTVTPAGNQNNTIRVEGGQQGAKGDTLVVTSGSAASFQTLDLSINADQNRTLDAGNSNNKIGPVVQGFENVDATAATINMNITALDRTSITNTGSVAATISGSVIQGGTGRDTLTGGTGNDSLVGNDGNDVITGGAGNDTISGGVGDDNIDGGIGADSISSGTGADTVTGGAGNDTINVDGSGTKSIDGGADNDTITVTADQGSTTTVSTISGNTGNDTIVLNATGITVASRVSVSGGAGSDTITAGLGAETVNAGSGNDTVKITAANLGANDVFNGNDGQDIIQLEIPTGSGTNTFTFDPGASATAASRFSGFEAIALIDSSTNLNAKQYKINLTDTFVAQNFQNGSFLIDARGLPGGSNLVIDFSGLTAASAALFQTGAFRVLTSPSTDVRDQNNVTITAAYSVQTGNPVLNNVQGFTVYSGETSIIAGTEAAYTTDRKVNTGSTATTGTQAVYTTEGGTAETGTGTTTAGGSFVVNAASAVLTSTVIGAGATAGTAGVPFLSAGNDTITATRLDSVLIQDASTADADVLNAIVAGNYAGLTPTITNIETVNLVSNAVTNLTVSSITGASVINVSGTTAQLLAVASRTIGLGSDFTGTLTANGDTAGNDTATLRLNGASAAFSTDLGATGTDTLTLNVTGNSTISTFTANAALSAVNITGSGNLTLTAANAGVFNANGVGTSAYTGVLTLTTSATVSTVNGGSGNDVLTTAGDVAHSIFGGAGNDTINVASAATAAVLVRGGAGNDTITFDATAAGNTGVAIFEESASANGVDTIANFAAGNALNKLDFTAFVSERASDTAGMQATGATTVGLFTTASAGAVEVHNEVVFFDNSAGGATATALTAATLAAEFAAGQSFATIAGQRTVVVEGNGGTAGDVKIWYVADTDNNGVIAASEVVQVGTLSNVDIATINYNQIL